MSNQPKVNNEQIKDGEQLMRVVEEATKRGHTVEIHSTKDGLKVFEVTKKIRATITK